MLAKSPFRISLSIKPLPFDKKKITVYGEKEFTLFFDDIDAVQTYIDRCLKDKIIHEKTEED